MACKTRMYTIESPITYVYAVFFILGCIVAVVGNILALIILFMPSVRSRSNKILTPLAFSDLLVGVIVFPITDHQVLNHKDLNSCTVDYIRVYFSVFLEGASVLTLAIIALDRYLLLTKTTIYYKTSTKRAMVVLLLLAWLIPGLTPILRWVSKTAYLVLTITIFVGPFFILLVSYVFITKALRDQENRLKQQQVKSFQKGNSTKQLSVPDDAVEERGVSVFSKRSNVHLKMNNFKSQRSHIKVAKAVTLLLLAYFCCIAPINTWLILDLINASYPFMPINAHQNLYLFAMVAVSYNSCINPLIYFWKNPGIRKGLKRLVEHKRRLCTT